MSQDPRPLPYDLPSLPTMGVGSYAPPGWFIALRAQVREGKLGEVDIAEMLHDATRVIVGDQLNAGVDVLTDGEIRRQRFVYEMYQHIEGLERLPPARRVGITGYDVTPRFRALGPLSTPHGFGLVDDLASLVEIVGTRPVKIALPGPLTFLGAVDPGDRRREDLIEDAVRMVRAELHRLDEASVRYLQIDEPLLAHPPLGLGLDAAAELISRCADGLSAFVAVHVCFGNNAGRPFADRRFSRLRHAMEALRCDQLVLELANREMAEVDLLGELAQQFHIAAGVVDVKNFYVESAADVCRRVQHCLQFVPVERLTLTADCGFSALPRYIARQKLEALVAGAQLARAGL